MKRRKGILAIFAVIIMVEIAFGNVVISDSENEKDGDDAKNAGENVPDVGFSNSGATHTMHHIESFGDESDIEFAPGELIVKFKNSLTIENRKVSGGIVEVGFQSIDSLNREYNVTGIEKIFKNKAIQNLSNIYKLTLEKNSNILAVAREYEKDPHVEYAEPNYIYHTCVIPNDPDFDLQWALNQPSDHDIDAPEAWDIETGNKHVVIAIIDTGVDYNHPDLAGNIWINEDEIPDNGIDDDGNGYVDDIRGWDFVNTTASVWPGEDGTIRDNDPMDFHGHGTHCSGIAGAITNNSIGIAGVCWNCSIMAVRAGYKGSDGGGYLENDDSAAAIVYAVDNGANVISMSWGSYYSSNLIKNALDYAYNNGVVLVAAAGNDNVSTKHYPAGYDNVISVSATDSNGVKAIFSNYGSWIDVAAPGVNIYSTYLNGTYTSLSGTSMACPFVAGLAGLILSKNPSFSQEEVRTILRSTTDNISSSKYVGIGRINAYKAMLRNSTPIANLNSSLDDAVVNGTIDIVGTANGSTFASYTVYFGEGVYPTEWTEIEYSTIPITNGTLASWDTSREGVISLKLEVEDISGNISEDRVVITVNNVYIIRPIEKEVFGWGTVNITGRAAVTNFSYYKVEYRMQNETENWTLINYSINPIIDGVLANWNISSLTGGTYVIRLTVNNTDYETQESISVIIDKTLQVGWPKETGGRIISSPTFADLDGDGYLEVIVGSNDGKVYAWHYDGTLLDGWPKKIYDGGEDSFSPMTSSPAVGDIDEDGLPEVVFSCGEYGEAVIYAWNEDGSNVPGWPVQLNWKYYGCSSPVISDLNGDGALEVITAFNYYPKEGRVCVFNNTGSLLWEASMGERTYSTPSVGDIDGDGGKEVVCGCRNSKVYAWHCDGTNVTGWPQSADDAICDSPKLADLDGDGKQEVITRGFSEMYVWYGNGSRFPGWPQDFSGGHTNSAVGDIDKDGELEIVCADICWMHVWNSDGSYVNGWPQPIPLEEDCLVIPHWIGSGAILGDIDGDGDIEIIGSTCHSEGGGGRNGKLFAWHHNGTMVSGWPKLLSPHLGEDIYGEKLATAVRSTAALGDIDKDGDIEIGVGGEGCGKMYIWDLSGSYAPNNIEWPMFQHDPYHTGWYGFNLLPTVNFTYLPSLPTTADIIQFMDQSTDNDGTIVNWTWNFGDGNISYEKNPRHRYADDGTYNVTLTVTDNDGATNTIQKSITVLNAQPTAQFKYSPADLYTIQFTDLSYDNDGSIVNYTWNFGDGAISHEQNPQHQYADNGVYTVTLTVTDDDGATDSIS
ncbi:MAG: PKD domain-containing protein, partial [Thermoplasmata archaeon]